jgi:cytochrome b
MPGRNNKLVWDLPVRIFHWLLVILIPWSWFSVEINDDLDTHMLLGYCILSLVIFRIVWGIIGTRYARFGSLIFPVREYLSGARSFFSRHYGNYTGHNPLGALSVAVLLLLLSMQTVTGLFANDEDYYFGPLSDNVSTKAASLLTTIHHINFNILLGFIVLHILSVLFYLVYKKLNLLIPMITGTKPDHGNTIEPIAGSRLVPATILMLCCCALVYCLVRFA